MTEPNSQVDVNQLMRLLIEAQATNREALAENREQNKRWERAYNDLREGDKQPSIVTASPAPAVPGQDQTPSLQSSNIKPLKGESNYEDWRGDWNNHLLEAGLRKYVDEDLKCPEDP